MIKSGATHVAVATDHVIESFRNGLWPGYKTSEGIEASLLAQFLLLEEALSAAGVVVWPMVEFEADDALASAATTAALDARVDRVIICTPDKDLSQCVRGTRVVQLIRRTRMTLDEAGVVAEFGVPPVSIPDYLALVGDAADGYPGLPGWGAKSTAAVLAKFGHIESIPSDWHEWHVNTSSAGTLAATLSRERDRALLFRALATLRTDIALFEDVEQLRWNGPTRAWTCLRRVSTPPSPRSPRHSGPVNRGFNPRRTGVCFNGGEVTQMESKQKMAIAGSGLVAAGIGLSIVGTALIAPAVFAWAARLVERGATELATKVEGASKTVGTVAGTLHRSFSEAKKAGVAETRRGHSAERNVAS